MDFAYHYTKEQEAFRQEIRTWLKKNVPEEMKRPLPRIGLVADDYSEEQYRFWRQTHPKLAEKGWIHPTLPKEYGGGGLTPGHETIISEEFDRARIPRDFSNPYVCPPLLVWATEEQKQKFLVPIVKAQKAAFQLFTEPNAGSDLASLQSRAVRDGDDWVLTGQKIFITGTGDPDLFLGPFITDPDAPRHRNLGFFVIPCPWPGLEIRRQNLLSGYDSLFVFMDNVRLPGDHLIGGDHQGWQVTGTTLEIEHGGRGAAFPQDEAMESLFEYVRTTRRFGETLGSDPIVQQAIMAAYGESQIDMLLAKRNYWMYQARQEMSYHGSQFSLWGREYRMRNADRARDIMGMDSLLGTDEPRAPFKGLQEVYQRASLVGAHPGGTIEVQKVIVARRLGISRTRERAAATPSTSGVAGV
ncbi:MAG: acyl-CoA dehydrogenase family protein [Chloroflexi bacterium]|nr:acyl-CoA dehydrogenase family protein [Chloroflexota bacterium]